MNHNNEQNNSFKKQIFSAQGFEKSSFFKGLNSYVYLYCEITEDNKRNPIYIGKGKSDRCLSHLSDLDNLSSKKTKKIRYLLSENKLGIDILAHGLDEKTALAIESACIDLMGIDNLENLDNEIINNKLLSIFGIGPWSVNMFEIFCNGNLNVFKRKQMSD